MKDRVNQVIQDSATQATYMFGTHVHKHQWLCQSVWSGKDILFYTGNLVCSCGEIVWRDEVESIMTLSSTLPEIRLFGLRGNFPSGKSAQQSVQLTAFGASLRVRLGNYLIRLGCRLAKHGGN